MQAIEQLGERAGSFLLGDRYVKRLGYGAMQLAGPGVFGPPRDHDAALAVLREAVAAGVNHVDTSDFYGPHVTNRLIHEALTPYPKDLVIVTKVGAVRGDDASWNPAQEPDQLRAAVEDNLRRMFPGWRGPLWMPRYLGNAHQEVAGAAQRAWEASMHAQGEHPRVLLAARDLLARGLLVREDDPERAAVRIDGHGFRYHPRFWTLTGVLEVDGSECRLRLQRTDDAERALRQIAREWINAGAPADWAWLAAENAVMSLIVRPDSAARA